MISRSKICSPYLLFLLLLCNIACSSSGKLTGHSFSRTSLSKLRQQIDSALGDSALHQSRTGIKVVSLETGQVLYAKDSELLFHPASNMKLLTTATALRKLGTNFRFKTTLSADTSSLAENTIHGNLYLKGFGSPTLTGKDLWWMIQNLKAKGIQRITGDLVCDESYLDDYYRGAGWMWDDASSSFYPPISALTVNRNCVTVSVTPGFEIGDSLAVTVDPQTSYITIENFGVTADSSDTTSLKAFKIERKWRESQNTIVIRGGLVPQSSKKVRALEIVEPALYVGTLFSELLAGEDILVDGEIRKGVLPDTNIVLVEHLSEPLPYIIWLTNKNSDNLYAELILKTLGAEIFGTPGTAQKGLSAIKLFFHEVGVDTTAFGLADGSGVSRYNMISPDHIIEILKAMYQNFGLHAEFMSALPIAGIDG
ncbi:MAG: D-alanyl-D-alanine carboxypeptidase/D-alanyl-D-alanine-endopeptidase, partial [bacterium]